MRSGPQPFAAMLFPGAALSLLLLMGAGHAQSSVSEGEKLAFDRGKGNCLTCHDIKGGDSPGNLGPPLKASLLWQARRIARWR